MMEDRIGYGVVLIEGDGLCYTDDRAGEPLYQIYCDRASAEKCCIFLNNDREEPEYMVTLIRLTDTDVR